MSTKDFTGPTYVKNVKGEKDTYEYALLRVVPRVERGECFNAGVLVYCRARSYVGALTHLDEAKLSALDPRADLAGVRAALRAVEGICEGGGPARPAAAGDAGRRLRGRVAPRPPRLQPGPRPPRRPAPPTGA
ncbi:DUF3037 domain-containing protein, partial [Streptomyces sp. NPDC059134]|uniref:DUF3037 domain-containing protein n=1 Tax=Streptomyces sp. NPDC059134 TaxID=3346738 RepID=UPI0036C5232F